MRTHTLNGLKAKARSQWLQVGDSETAQRMRGVTINSEGTLISTLYDSTSGYAWVVDGRFVSEDEAAGYLLDLKPATPKEITTRDALERFAKWRAQQLPVITAAASADPARYQRLLWMSQQWETLYGGPNGMQATQRMLDQKRHDQGWLNVLRAKQDMAEKGLFDVAEKFMAEFHRLEEVPA